MFPPRLHWRNIIAKTGADELVFYDITASAEGRGLFTDILRRVASEIFIPLTVGGGIRTLEDFDRVLKVVVDSGYSRLPVYEGSFDNVKAYSTPATSCRI